MKSENDGGFTEQIIASESNACARKHGLDKTRIYKIFLRLAETGWITPNFPRNTAFDEVLAFLPAKKALELFEKSDLNDLVNHKLSFDYLSEENVTPFYTLNELSEVIAAFIKYLQCNRDSLIKIGYPQISFARSSWLNWNLANLYYVKTPVAIQGNQLPFLIGIDGLAERDEERNLIYSFSWSPVLPSDEAEFGDGIFSFGIPGYGWTKNGPITENGQLLPLCDYKDAPYLKGLPERRVQYIEKDREKIFDLKIDILKIALQSLRKEDIDGFWERCLSNLVGVFTYKKTKEYLAIDALYSQLSANKYLSYLFGHIELYHHNGGISDLLSFIGHIEEEFSIGAFCKTKSEIHQVIPKKIDLKSYYQSIGKPWKDKLDLVLEKFLALENKAVRFLTKFQDQVNTAIESDFEETVTIEAPIKRRYAKKFKLYLQNYANFQRLHLRYKGYLPPLPIESIKNLRVQKVEPFPTPPGTTWYNVAIRFISNDAVKITAGNVTKKKTFAEMGFKDDRKVNKPDSLWELLKNGFGKCNGEISWGIRKIPYKKKTLLKKQVSMVRKRLKAYFGIDDDPFEPYKKFKAYKTKFHIEDNSRGDGEIESSDEDKDSFEEKSHRYDNLPGVRKKQFFEDQEYDNEEK